MPETFRQILMISKGDDLFQGLSADTVKRHEDYAQKAKAKIWMIVLTSEKNFAPIRRTDFSAYPTNSAFFFSYARDAKKTLRNVMAENPIPRFDLIVSQDPFFCAHVAIKLKNIFSCPLQIQDHSCFFSSPEFQKEKFFRPAMVAWGRRHLQKADHIRVVNHIEKKTIEKTFKNPVPIDVQPVPINTEIFKTIPSENEMSSFQNKTNISCEKNFHILWLGRFSPEKNLPLMLKGFSLFKKIHPEAKLVIAGPTPEQIRFLTTGQDGISILGKIDYHDLPKLYRSVDVLVSTSRYEGYGRVFIEALFSDLPIISTPTAGFLEAVPADLQIHFEPNENSLAHCLVYFLKNNDKTTFLKKVGIFKNSFNGYEKAMNTITEKWLNLMDKK